MNISKLNGMYELFLDYKYEISKNIPDKLKCAKCKNILINACQVPCGCRYCYDCVEGMLQNGVLHCPGNTDDCKKEYLSNNNFDYRANKKISKLIVKCPEETCPYECELIKMEEHLRICGKISKKCPFADLGCDNRKMESEILNEHCQSSNFNHCKILIEMIDNIKNEIDLLKIKDENNEKLKEEVKIKNELIDSVNEEMKLVKLENEDLKQKFESLKENMEKRFEEMSKEMKNENLEIIEMKIEKDEIKREFQIMKENSERKAEEIIEMQKENLAQIESINTIINTDGNNKSEMMETKINEMNKIIEKFEYATIEWTIDKLNERKNNNEIILSEYFTSKIKPYKLRLSFYADGWKDFKGKGCSIFFCVYSGTNDNFMSWPCPCDVTITILHKTNLNLNKSITKYCEIPMPPDNSYISSDDLDSPIQFDYSYSNFKKDGEILDNCLIVECFVNFK